MSQPTDPRGDAVQRFGAMALMAIGGMVVLLCGSCSLYFGGPVLWTLARAVLHLGEPVDSYGGGMAAVVVMMVLFVGGIPTAVGAMVFADGWRRMQRLKASPGPGA